MAPRAPPPAAAAGAGACIDRLMDGRRVNQSSAMTVLPDGLLPAPRPVLRPVQRQELPALPRAHARLDRLQVPQHLLPHLGAPLRPRVHEEERVALRCQPLPARAGPRRSRSAPPALGPGGTLGAGRAPTRAPGRTPPARRGRRRAAAAGPAAPAAGPLATGAGPSRAAPRGGPGGGNSDFSTWRKPRGGGPAAHPE